MTSVPGNASSARPLHEVDLDFFDFDAWKLAAGDSGDQLEDLPPNPNFIASSHNVSESELHVESFVDTHSPGLCA